MAATPRLARFGLFELDLRTGELRKKGMEVHLQEQPFQVLAMLVERAGDVVKRGGSSMRPRWRRPRSRASSRTSSRPTSS